MGGYYKINRTELKADMEMQGITNLAENLQKIKLIERGALEVFEKQRAAK